MYLFIFFISFRYKFLFQLLTQAFSPCITWGLVSTTLSTSLFTSLSTSRLLTLDAVFLLHQTSSSQEPCGAQPSVQICWPQFDKFFNLLLQGGLDPLAQAPQKLSLVLVILKCLPCHNKSSQRHFTTFFWLHQKNRPRESSGNAVIDRVFLNFCHHNHLPLRYAPLP